MNKEANRDSGYRIRFDLLQLARDILSEQQGFNWQLRDHKLAKGEDVPAEDPKPFTTEDVLKEAEKLYEFVQKK